ncbi:MAG TPA: hypothetical protein DCR17_12670 [Verrucomicrobiales bacterium]|nr:hypothetical protein [Pedosphaera sp.]HAO67523.1 hypothetical protein [Verrucomicrobiales bacterium]HBP56987.1 hypothetical protein [Verrucomicrobiales bacterium]HCP40054.1 hypothetical protein [Verrucomicrobiales bacterium]HCZ02833.1 hypothetical protein [Verrucomicrobiales bacterium]
MELLSKRAELIINGLARSHGQHNKVIQVNAVIQILSSEEKADCRVPCCTTKLVYPAKQYVIL